MNIESLPKWAQRKIEILEREKRELQEQIEIVNGEKSRYVANQFNGGYPKKVYLPDDLVSIIINGIEFSADGKERVVIRTTDHYIRFYPHSSNVMTVERYR